MLSTRWEVSSSVISLGQGQSLLVCMYLILQSLGDLVDSQDEVRDTRWCSQDDHLLICDLNIHWLIQGGR